MYVKMLKTDVLAALAKNIKLAEQQDQQDLKEFKKKCHAEFMEFNRLLRLASKWSYEEYVKHKSVVQVGVTEPWQPVFDGGHHGRSLPSQSCPSTAASRLSRVVWWANSAVPDKNGYIRVDEGSPLANALTWVPRDQAAPQSLCQLAGYKTDTDYD